MANDEARQLLAAQLQPVIYRNRACATSWQARQIAARITELGWTPDQVGAARRQALLELADDIEHTLEGPEFDSIHAELPVAWVALRKLMAVVADQIRETVTR